MTRHFRRRSARSVITTSTRFWSFSALLFRAFMCKVRVSQNFSELTFLGDILYSYPYTSHFIVEGYLLLEGAAESASVVSRVKEKWDWANITGAADYATVRYTSSHS